MSFYQLSRSTLLSQQKQSRKCSCRSGIKVCWSAQRPPASIVNGIIQYSVLDFSVVLLEKRPSSQDLETQLSDSDKTAKLEEMANPSDGQYRRVCQTLSET